MVEIMKFNSFKDGSLQVFCNALHVQCFADLRIIELGAIRFLYMKNSPSEIPRPNLTILRLSFSKAPMDCDIRFDQMCCLRLPRISNNCVPGDQSLPIRSVYRKQTELLSIEMFTLAQGYSKPRATCYLFIKNRLVTYSCSKKITVVLG